MFRECTHPLLLNAIAIGSLYLGPKDSVAKVSDIESMSLYMLTDLGRGFMASSTYCSCNLGMSSQLYQVTSDSNFFSGNQ